MPDTTHSPLHGRTVVVTGAARGIGAALAHQCSRRGARLALIGLEPAGLDAVAAALPGPALAIEADVTDPAALDAAADTVRRRLGRPSVVIANAGIAASGPFATSDPATWSRVIDVNLTGSAHTARAFLPDLMETGGYHLQIASTAALAAAPMPSAYCASKSGVEAFTHALRAEVAHHGVAVGIAYLNWTDTDMIRDGDRHAALRELCTHMPCPAHRVHPVDPMAARLVRAVERRRTTVYAPPWLRLAQLARPALPRVVLRVSRRDLPRLEAREDLAQTGPLGAGGRADRASHDRPRAPRERRGRPR
ncbi:SDR family oxidoreductase [Streptomyces broussonetiae]|uniref:SDR family oxidoreductase n=1 Tax=Streptomyces broussonetiae TaxID=2686304 RepID=A0ABV5ELX6_9ACTN